MIFLSRGLAIYLEAKCGVCPSLGWPPCRSVRPSVRLLVCSPSQLKSRTIFSLDAMVVILCDDVETLRFLFLNVMLLRAMFKPLHQL